MTILQTSLCLVSSFKWNFFAFLVTFPCAFPLSSLNLYYFIWNLLRSKSNLKCSKRRLTKPQCGSATNLHSLFSFFLLGMPPCMVFIEQVLVMFVLQPIQAYLQIFPIKIRIFLVLPAFDFLLSWYERIIFSFLTGLSPIFSVIDWLEYLGWNIFCIIIYIIILSIKVLVIMVRMYL